MLKSNYTDKNKNIMKKLKLSSKRLPKRFALLVVAAVFAAGSLGAYRIVGAQTLQQQIDELTQKNNETKSVLADLKEQAASYQDAINILQAQINEYQRQINQRQAEKEQIEREIVQKEEELAHQRQLLGQNIKAMYIEGDITTIEMLATSKSLSDFLDKQQYREVVKNKIKTTVDKITALRAELQTKKEEVEKIIKQQEQLRAQAAAQKAEQDKLLGYNRSQQSEFDKQIKDNQARINELKRQQAIENARLFGGTGGQLGGGGYPWGHAPCLHTGQVEGWCYNYDWAVNGSVWNWQLGGYGYRNCTDWVAYRVRIAGGYVPPGLGNAKLWDDRAPAYGLTVSSVPRVGAAAVSNSGYYGHVMYVEAVNPDGSIVVSDYNRAGTGKYDINQLSAATAANLRYVYF